MNKKKILILILVCVLVYVTSTLVYISMKNKDYNITTSNKPLYKLEDYPKVDASLATQPLTNAFIKNFTGLDNIDITKLNYSNTHPAYEKLINGEVDLIVVTEPSKEELELAKQKNVELEVIPVVKEGFVFYVNSENKVSNLTVEQIRKIYTGEITNWKEVGGIDNKITAYQRPVNSGSQTGMLSLVMKDLKLMDAPKENLIASMEEIINLVSSYKNGKDAIGYSYYYYATTMFETIDKNVASNIKLLSIDGIKPNSKTIKDSSYPFTTAYYIVINKKDGKDSKSRILLNYMLSKRGQNVALKAGYVPVK